MIIWGVEMTVDFHAIGQRIRQKRREKHMTQEALAEALSVSVGYVSNMERGITKISLTTLAKIAGAVDCELGELVSGTAAMEKDYLDTEFSALLSRLNQEEKRMLLRLLKTYLDEK